MKFKQNLKECYFKSRYLSMIIKQKHKHKKIIKET